MKALPDVRSLTLDQTIRAADATMNHSRQCKKTIDACETCRAVVAWFALIPLDRIALVLQDRPTKLVSANLPTTSA